MTIRSITSDPARFGFLVFTSTLVIQMMHETEHVLQMLEKYVWYWGFYPGLLGAWFDFEWIHMLYNGALWFALMSTWIAQRRNPGMWRISSVAAGALAFATVFQAYHWVEHLVRVVQYSRGILKPPGMIGFYIPILELHFVLGTIVSTAMIIAYVGFRPWCVFRFPSALAPSTSPSTTLPAATARFER